MKVPEALPALVFADKHGNIGDLPELTMMGKSNDTYVLPELDQLIPLPEGSELFLLPERLPVGGDPLTGEPMLVDTNPHDPEDGIQAVAAFMAPAHTAILSAAYQKMSSKSSLLPLFAYTAIGWYDDQFWVSGFRSDTDIRQDAAQFHHDLLGRKTQKKVNRHPGNRLIQHLGNCCLTYCCPAAQNYFLERWEAPLPTSPDCNARCLGCISLQPSGTCPSTQQRIRFIPSPDEVYEIANEHIEIAERPIVSFGQGCEGEPLVQWKTIDTSIAKIRASTSRGTINLNSNASLPTAIKTLAKTGLDSLRVSLNSVQKKYYTPYYRPKGYQFENVIESIKVMKDAGKFVSLNYFILPGVTDSQGECDALYKLLEQYEVDMIQLRNINIDPQWYLETIEFPKDEKGTGIITWRNQLRQNFPELKLGYFNPYLGKPDK